MHGKDIACSSSPSLHQDVPSLEVLEQEVAWVQEYLSQLGSPVVLCHNDLLCKNIIYNEAEGGFWALHKEDCERLGECNPYPHNAVPNTNRLMDQRLHFGLCFNGSFFWLLQGTCGS